MSECVYRYIAVAGRGNKKAIPHLSQDPIPTPPKLIKDFFFKEKSFFLFFF